MLQARQGSMCMRRALALCLALLFSLAFLNPLTAGALNGSASSCCRTHNKCCCKKTAANNSHGPVFTNRTCGDQCGALTLSRIGDGGVMPFAHRSAMPLWTASAGVLAGGQTVPMLWIGGASRVRPPPSSPRS